VNLNGILLMVRRGSFAKGENTRYFSGELRDLERPIV
jgi:hypothetical protein